MIEISLPKVVLIADDDHDTRIIVSTAVKQMGCTPLVASDGEKALAHCRETTPDVAVLDVMMPGLTGLEVCERLKKLEGGEMIPVLILTARDSVQDKVSALEEGADDYLTKPFHIRELQARVTALLRVRELNMRLQEKNEELQRVQQKLVEQERQMVATQLAGTAAHQLGQPLSAMILNCHILETLDLPDPRHKKALKALRTDAQRMAGMIEKLKTVDATQTSEYYHEVDILDIEGEK